MSTKNICFYIENIREGKNLTREEFLDSIVSIRQYKRYLYGESEMPYHIFEKICLVLNLKPINVLYEFHSDQKKEVLIINEIYKTIVRKNLNEAKKLMITFDETTISDYRNQVYFKHCLLLFKFYSKTISNCQFIEESKRLIDYPAILKNKIIDSIELIVLNSLLEYSNQVEKDKITTKMYNYISEENTIISGNSDFIKPYLLVSLANQYGLKGDFCKVIELCEDGISRSKARMDYYNLEFFYYYKALGEYRLNLIEDSKDSLYYCYNVLALIDNETHFKKFNNLIEKDFGIKYQEFMFSEIKKRTNSI